MRLRSWLLASVLVACAGAGTAEDWGIKALFESLAKQRPVLSRTFTDCNS